MTIRYTPVGTEHGPAWIREGSERALGSTDVAAFDCDGVLVDSRNSYDVTTVRVVERLIGEMLGVRLPWKREAPRLIHMLRKTGGFNNDWDTTYALCLFITCSMPMRFKEALATARRFPVTLIGEVTAAVPAVFSEVNRIIVEYVSTKGQVGHSSADRFVRERMSPFDQRICDLVRAYAGYPGSPPKSRLATLYDEMYHGPALFEELYGVEPKYFSGTGLITKDRVLVTRADLRRLAECFGDKLAIDTGRPRKAVEYSLRNLLSFFDLDASVFIGDGEIGRERERVPHFDKKPNPASLLHVRDKLGSSNLLYVGDSAEDVLMATDVRTSSGGVTFAGVYGASHDTRDQVEFFRREGVELILPSVRDLPGLYRRLAQN